MSSKRKIVIFICFPFYISHVEIFASFLKGINGIELKYFLFVASFTFFVFQFSQVIEMELN